MDDGRGLRFVLQPVLYVGVAAILHALLFLIPGGGPAKRDSETTRGIRVKTFVEGPPAVAPQPPTASRPPVPEADPSVGKDVAVDSRAPGRSGGDEGGPSGPAGPSQGPVVGSGGPMPQSDYGQYLSRLRSEGVQGWARESARASRKGWKGSGAGAGGWGAGTGTSTGTGTGTGDGRGRGGGSGGGPNTVFMDSRVRMIVIQYPLDERGSAVVDQARNIESRFRQVQYPDLKIKKSQYTSGWWNVYFELRTGPDGKPLSLNVLRPETDGPLERIFVEQVRREVARWDLDPTSEIHVDVRFHVE